MENDSNPSQTPSEPTPMPPEFIQVQDSALSSPHYRSAQKTRKTGIILTLLAPIFAISPFLIALVMVHTCPGGATNANEGNCGWAALPWLTFATIPMGAVIFVVGIVMLIIGSAKEQKFLEKTTRN